jgi:Ca2+-binding RTX toxin-like protein
VANSINTLSNASELYLSVYDSTTQNTYSFDTGITLETLLLNVNNVNYTFSFNLATDVNWTDNFLGFAGFNPATTIYALVVGSSTNSDLLSTSSAVGGLPTAANDQSINSMINAVQNHAKEINTLLIGQSIVVNDSATPTTGQFNNFNTLFGGQATPAAMSAGAYGSKLSFYHETTVYDATLDSQIPILEKFAGSFLLTGNTLYFGNGTPTTNSVPTLTTFSTVATGNSNSQITITLADLLNSGNEVDSDGTVNAFVIKAVTSGTLKIGSSAPFATDWDAISNNIVDQNLKAFWTPGTDASGTLDAFTAVAKDNSGDVSATPVQAQVAVSEGGVVVPPIGNNTAPTLDSPSTINYTDTIFDDTFVSKTGNLIGNDADPLTYGIVGGIENGSQTTISKTGIYGTLTVTKATGAYKFVPNDLKIEPLKTNASEQFIVTTSDGAKDGNNELNIIITQSKGGKTESINNDILTGTKANNKFNGLAGNDTIKGMGGNDFIIGGLGADKLTGGAGKDTFDFNSSLEIGKKGATRDSILDFTHGQDKIDLSGIDAKIKTSANDKFTFIGSSAFHNKAGELQYVKGVLSGDTDGNGKADFEMLIVGIQKFVPAEFVL